MFVLNIMYCGRINYIFKGFQMLRKRNKLVFGVGTNDADYRVVINQRIKGKFKTVWNCPFYAKWRDMLKRCYSSKFKKKYPTYEGCFTAKEWLLFSNFKAWMQTQDWEGKHLDKDILFEGNKIYGPDACIFVDAKVNLFISESPARRGEYPIGVNLKGNRFQAMAKSIVTGRQQYLGMYDTPEEAHKAWFTFKLEQAYLLAAQQTDERVAKALIDRYENYYETKMPVG